MTDSSTQDSGVHRILLRSSWQMANIGDMAHAPSAIGLLDRHAPDIEVVLWARRISDEERATLLAWYPRLRIVTGEIDALGQISTTELAEEFDRCTFLLHGSGRLLAGEPDVTRWRQRTGKPYGFLGITVDPVSPPVQGSQGAIGTLTDLGVLAGHLGSSHMPVERQRLLRDATFVYCRDGISVRYLAQHGIGTNERVRFGPDAVFAFDTPLGMPDSGPLRRQLGLPDNGYVCFVPRLRYTPYHQTLGTSVGQAEMLKDAINATYREHDLGVLKDLIIQTVRTTGRRALICPEMDYAGALGAEIAAELPEDVRDNVSVMSKFWDPAIAMSVYADAAAVVSMECHSPILAARVGVPSFYLRQPTDTIKGQMWAELGMSAQIFELEAFERERLFAALASCLERSEWHAAQAKDNGATAEKLLGTLVQKAVGFMRADAAARDQKTVRT